MKIKIYVILIIYIFYSTMGGVCIKETQQGRETVVQKESMKQESQYQSGKELQQSTAELNSGTYDHSPTQIKRQHCLSVYQPAQSQGDMNIQICQSRFDKNFYNFTESIEQKITVIKGQINQASLEIDQLKRRYSTNFERQSRSSLKSLSSKSKYSNNYCQNTPKGILKNSSTRSLQSALSNKNVKFAQFNKPVPQYIDQSAQYYGFVVLE